MGEDAAQLRAEIDGVRTDLGYKVDAIEDRVRPRRVVDRRTEALRRRALRVRTAVMGTVEHGVGTATERMGGAADVMATSRSRAGDLAGSAADQLRQAPPAVASQVRGSPLAMGLVAFGAGLVAAALVPSTQAEQDASDTVRRRLEPMTHELADLAKESGQHVAAHAKEQARDLASDASDAAANLKDAAAGHVQDVAHHAGAAARDVRDAAESG